MKAIAMYLPQFHEVEENNRWWGEGFTDWYAVKSAGKLFDSHHQPRCPLNKHYYDLSDKSTMEWQAKLMKQYGIDGMCIYHYWFKDGKRILEKPVENLLKWKDIDMPFCFSWANETWARTWAKLSANAWAPKFEVNDGDMQSAVLLQQDYGMETQWKKHFEYLLPFFRDSRYIKKDGKPIFMIYKPEDIGCFDEMCDMWNSLAREKDFPGIYFIAASDNQMDSNNINKYYSHQPRRVIEKIVNNIEVRTTPITLDYDMIWRIILSDIIDKENTCFGAFVDFDTTPRSGEKGVITYGANPEKFKKYLTELMAKNEAYGNDITFINAWNEWGEGMYLEPDEGNEYAYLEAIEYAKKHYVEYVPEYRSKKKLNMQGIWENYGLLEKKTKQFSVRSKTFDQWLTAIEKGKSISAFLTDKRIDSLVIYGMGRLGRHLISDLKESDIVVKYVIDKRESIANLDVPVFKMENVPFLVNTVIVTLDNEFETVVQALKEKGFENVLLISDIIKEMG